MRTDIYERTGVDIRTGVEVFFKNGARVDYPHCWCDFSNIDNGIVLVRQNNQAIEAYVNWVEVAHIKNRTGQNSLVY